MGFPGVSGTKMRKKIQVYNKVHVILGLRIATKEKN